MLNKKSKILISLLLITLFGAFIAPKSNDLKSLIKYKLNTYADINYSEKIYIHTDKPYYSAGESIWFSSYLVNGVSHKVSEKSFVIHVELINSNDSIIEKRKLFTETLSAKGEIKLPQDLKEGDYLLRGYTNYMRNQGNGYFFKKDIKVYSTSSPEYQTDEVVTVDKNISETNNKTFSNQEIGFFPEGGDLVNGVTSRVAIKVEGQSIDSNILEGVIVDNDGNKVTDFKTYEFGMGVFYLTPDPLKSYRAIISSEKGNIEYPLPTALTSGYVLNTSINKDQVIVKITTNIAQGLKDISIVGHQRGDLKFDYTENRDIKTTMVQIPKKDLTEGILSITLFNKLEKPVAERLVFVNKDEDAPTITIERNIDKVTQREKVTVELGVKDKLNKNISSTISVSITDAEIITLNKNAENIKTWFLLNSDLRGEIDSPNYFFTEGETIKKQYLLDLTMMTHGWRRFTWQQLLENEMITDFEPEKGIYIKGNTLSTEKPYLNKVTNTKLTFKYKGIYQDEKRTDENGLFSYGPFIFNDSIDVIIQATETSFLDTKKENFNTRINIKSDLTSPAIKRNSLRKKAFIKNKNIVAYKNTVEKITESTFSFEKDRELLKEVYIKTNAKTEEQIKNIERDKRTLHNNKPTHRIVVEDQILGQPDMLSLLLNLPQVRIEPIDGTSTMGIKIFGGTPTILLDNVRVTAQDILTLQAQNVEFIDVLRGPDAIRYPLEVYGVIAVFTKRGSRGGKVSKTSKFGTLSFKKPGFYTAQEFYAPDYSKESTNFNNQDIRSTLHWEPEINTSTSGTSSFSFYTSDIKGPYTIQIEGITYDGVPFYKTANFTVE